MDFDQASTSSSSVIGGAVEQEDPFVSPEMSQPGPAIVEISQDNPEHRFYSRHQSEVDVAHDDRVHGTNQFGFPPHPHVTYGAQPSGLYIPPQRRFTTAIPISYPTTWAHRTPSNSLPPFNTTSSQQFPVFRVHQSVAAMDSAVPFDPSSDPPFLDRAKLFVPRANGVIRIKNIPYGLTLAEVHQFICKHLHSADLIKAHEEGFPIHIIMERSTGKTMDAYIETASTEVAAQAWEHGFGPACMRHPKLGQRHVTVELSDQAELMADLFPRARCVLWNREKFGIPTVVQTNDIYTSGFKGFFTAEEMNGVIRHAEYPQRSPFAMRSFQRTFESTISTLYKFPWYTPDLYTLAQRDLLFKTYMRQLEILIVKVDPGSPIPREVGLDNKLLMDFLFAGMNCTGFSERQKATITEASRRVGPGMQVSRHARNWPFQTLSTDNTMLSDQDIAMWFEVLNLGMMAFHGEGLNFIGIRPYLEVIRDDNGFVYFTYTDLGAELSRKIFARMESKVMKAVMRKGWSVYMRQLGIPGISPEHDTFATAGHNMVVGGAEQNDDGFSDTGIFSDNDRNAIGPALEAHQYTDEERLAAYRKVLADIKREEGAALLGQVDRYSSGNYVMVDDSGTDGGLASGMMGLDLGSTGRVGPKSSGSDHLNPESANFQPSGVSTANLVPPQVWNQTTAVTDDSANVDTAFFGSGIGNGAISPPRISTARQTNVAGPSTLGPAPVFQVPAHVERRAVNITSLDGTPLSFHATNTGSPTTVRRNSLMDQGVMGGATGSPYRQGNAASYSYPATPRRYSDAPVLMPSAGRPSPGHIRNFGMGTNITFGAVGSGSPYSSPNRNTSPARSAVGTPLTSGMGIGMAMGPPPAMMMTPGRTGTSAVGRGGYVDTPRPARQGHTRTQSRSTLSVSETIHEEGGVHDNTVGMQPREY
ncbi:hypothetical protein EDD36DRAFT_6348 [Exophiala viscosa]|uniref:Uncharacterized protein n=1 Tax=Exophiala viscosa TaxID=2486360 RepID=A0AAN6IHS1_9EURO|nr:hypothetical protein EDD36DRAFT_6348 [Exophiala viscosa]